MDIHNDLSTKVRMSDRLCCFWWAQGEYQLETEVKKFLSRMTFMGYVYLGGPVSDTIKEMFDGHR